MLNLTNVQTLSHQDAGRVLNGEQLDCTITEGLTGIQLCNVWYLDYISHEKPREFGRMFKMTIYSIISGL